eukprot:CAMPEP_0204295604 /NCGR_PEP_ID=MMETSP0468-20130131/69969_1 /ASSEMBLY_ACC=CAM_ASM_000383 /TAXON_ID=2969 /ORGANISM="Oxyrrhis marina" /LENGTH=160 /DNA_ID=CAMNT_0051274239 /DNA_START=127 /DNA_END=606 /DNA_ORIENTATION=-
MHVLAAVCYLVDHLGLLLHLSLSLLQLGEQHAQGFGDGNAVLGGVRSKHLGEQEFRIRLKSTVTKSALLVVMLVALKAYVVTVRLLRPVHGLIQKGELLFQQLAQPVGRQDSVTSAVHSTRQPVTSDAMTDPKFQREPLSLCRSLAGRMPFRRAIQPMAV